MRLIVNGEMMEMRSAPVCGPPTLADVLDVFDYAGAWLATAVNGELVPCAARDRHPIRDGDRIEILTPLQGG